MVSPLLLWVVLLSPPSFVGGAAFSNSFWMVLLSPRGWCSLLLPPSGWCCSRGEDGSLRTSTSLLLFTTKLGVGVSGHTGGTRVMNLKKGSCQKGSSRNYWHVSECAQFKHQNGACSEAGVPTNTQLNLLMKRKNEHPLHVTFQRLLNAKCNYRNSVGSQNPRPRHLAHMHVLKREIGTDRI